jgi:hypothetical protein
MIGSEKIIKRMFEFELILFLQGSAHVGAVFSDFSAAFDIIDHNLWLEKSICYGFTPPGILWMTEHKGCSLMVASPS